MEQEQTGLEHYLAVRNRERPPRFRESRAFRIPEWFEGWGAHDSMVRRMREAETENTLSRSPGRSLLDLKIDLAGQMMDSCDLCPHHCLVNRNEGKVGFCGVGGSTAVHWEGILCGEEIELVPSHEVFLSGCTMRCAFCYSHEHITRPMSGLTMSPKQIAACADSRHGQGATNLNLVGGEPTVHIPNILRTLRELDAATPVVWNSNMYATSEAMKLLDGAVDLFLGDIHFGNPGCAAKLGRIPDYLPSVQAAFHMACDSGASLIIRHLVMPGHIECCARPAMEWATRELPSAPFHLMFQYIPDYRAVGDPVLGRTLSTAEIARARAIAKELGVNLYRGRETGPRALSRRVERPSASVGETVDILVHDGGRVSFMRLLEELVPVAEAVGSAGCADRRRPLGSGKKEQV